MNRDQILAALQSVAPSLRMDAAETTAFSRQLETVLSRTFDVKYPALKARDLIPLSREADSAAETIVYRMWDQIGAAKILANYADDLPRVDAFATEYTSRVYALGDSFGYSIQDMRRSTKTGSDLDAKKAMAARRAFEQAVDDIAMLGNPATGLPGFANHPNVSIVAPTNGDWANTSGTTPEEIIADLNKLATYVVTQSKDTFQPDTMVFGIQDLATLSSRFMDSTNTQTVLMAFLRANPWIKQVDASSKLDTAGADGGSRVVCYARNPEVLELHITQDFEMFPPQARGLMFEIACHGRVGGTIVYYPIAMAYMDP